MSYRVGVLASLVFLGCAAGPTGPGGAGGSGGGGGGGGAGGSGGASGGAGGVPEVCVSAAECQGLDGTCLEGTCINGACAQLPAHEAEPCSDGLFCTEDDVCHDGVCQGTAAFCPSPGDCQLGVCDESSKSCVGVAGNDGGDCDDKNACTGIGSCLNGACTQGKPTDCSFFSGECSQGVCDPVLGCVGVPKNEGTLCNLGQFDYCAEGHCNLGTCKPYPVNDGAFCDDGQFCTVNDSCQAGQCTGDPNPCGQPNNPCMVAVCDNFNWTCNAVPGNDGSGCDDGNLCTVGDSCLAGTCQAGAPGNVGAPCDDGDGCTSGETCAGGVCTNAVQVNNACGVDGDQCCPAGCQIGSDSDCLYWAPGVQKDVPVADLSGWTQCFLGDYDAFGPSMASILAQCPGQKLLVACRPPNAATLSLVAMADRADVLFDCGQNPSCVHPANGVGWYYSDSYSWGFAPAGEQVNRNSCDIGIDTQKESRMCWHTGGGQMNGGYRCGDNNMNIFGWQKLVYTAN